MSANISRWLLLSAVFGLLLFSETTFAQEEWDPISFAPSVGSFNVSVLYQAAVREKPCKEQRARDNKHEAYAEDKEDSAGGETCEGNADERTSGRKQPNALEFEFGRVEVDDLLTLRGQQDALSFVSASYRRYANPLRAKYKDRCGQPQNTTASSEDSLGDHGLGKQIKLIDCDGLRLFAGAGFGVYFVEPESELGWSLKAGLEFSWWERESRFYTPLEIGVTYHRLKSGFDFTDVSIGIRLHHRNR